MIFDWTISIGNLLTIIGFVGGGLLFVFTMRGDLKLFSYRLTAVETAIGKIEEQTAKITENLTQISTEKIRIDALVMQVQAIAGSVDELKHGEGFVYPLNLHRPKDG